MPIKLQPRILSLALLLLITACGQKGPLFMPDRDQPEQQTEARDR
ncbi:MAG: lipoprotein [Candidatus Thiodiazotropha sp.]